MLATSIILAGVALFGLIFSMVNPLMLICVFFDVMAAIAFFAAALFYLAKYLGTTKKEKTQGSSP